MQLDQLATLYQPTSMLTIENNQVQGAANIVAKYKVSGHVAVLTSCTFFSCLEHVLVLSVAVSCEHIVSSHHCVDGSSLVMFHDPAGGNEKKASVYLKCVESCYYFFSFFGTTFGISIRGYSRGE